MFLQNELILVDKVRVLVVLKCLCLTIRIFPLEPAHESMLPNLIMPSLNILIHGPWLLNNLHVYIQSVVLDCL
jgi:flagellar biosynthesis protein FliQ